MSYDMPNKIRAVIYALQDGRKIDALRAFKEAYNTGLRDAKDAIEAIDYAMRKAAENAVEDERLRVARATLDGTVGPTGNGGYLVAYRASESAHYAITEHSYRADAMEDAQNLTAHYGHIIVARIAACCVTTRTIKEL